MRVSAAAASSRRSSNPKFYAFRQRAALFGYNAVRPILLDQTQLTSDQPALLNSASNDWDFTEQPRSSANVDLYKSQLIDLDGVYSKIVPHGWIALITPDAPATRSPAGSGHALPGRTRSPRFRARTSASAPS